MDEYPEVQIADASEYHTDGQEGFVIVKRSDLLGPDGPIYVWPADWLSHPERKGVFPSLRDAQRALGLVKN